MIKKDDIKFLKQLQKENIKMILDPGIKDCTIWHNQMVTRIKGNADEICREIYKRVTAIVDFDKNGNPIVEQLCDIGIDIGGIGIEYKHILSEMGISTYDIRGRNKDVVLPVRNEQMVGVNYTLYEQERVPIRKLNERRKYE